MGKFKQEKTFCSRRVFLTFAFLLGLAIVLFTAGIVRAQAIPITGSLQRVTEPDSSIKTYIEIVIGDEFVGTLPDDIDEIIVRDPDGTVIAQYTPPLSSSGWTHYPQFRDFFINLDGEPAEGVYSFEVISNDGLTGMDTDHQYVSRDLPIPDASKFSPANGTVIDSKTPSFIWPLVDYAENIALYYRLEIIKEGGPVVYDRVFDTGRVRDLSFFTLPLNVLELNTNYRWRIRLLDNGIWENVQNRSNSEWLYFTTPGSWAAHASPPAIDYENWGSVTWSTENGTAYVCDVLIIDMDGVSSGGFSGANPMSHSVQVTFPDGGTYDLYFYRAVSPTSAYFEGYIDGLSGPPPSGTYTFEVTDPAGNYSIFSEDFNSAPLPLIDKNSITPTLKDEFITATFDNVNVKYVNGADYVLYDNFDSYGSIGDLNTTTLWQPWYGSDVSIVSGALQSTLPTGSIGRANGGLSFVNPENITAIQADITINSISNDDGPPRARLAGYFFNNGNADVWALINVNGDRIYYTVNEEYINEQGTWQWSNPLASGNLLTGISSGATYRVTISWDGSQLNFSADDLSSAGPVTASYIPTTGLKFPPIDPSKIIQTRINISTSTSPTFSWNPVSGANRYRLRVYNHDNSAVIWNGYSGEPTITVPPGILNPNSIYRYRIEARDANSPLNVDNVSKTPAFNDDNYIFYTDGSEAIEPFIDLQNSGVRTVTNEFSGTELSFWIEVHDAQGVPGDIQSVTVTHPGGAVEDLIYWGDNPYNPKTATSANYLRTSSFAPVDNGTYIFTVTDWDGHTFTINEALTVDPVGSMAASSMTAIVKGTSVAFDWADASGATFYNLTIFDYDFNRLYDFYVYDSYPPDSFLNIPVAFFEPGKLYHWRVNARREYFDQNIDNMSLTPGSTWAMPVFAINPPIDNDGDGMPDYWEELHGLNSTVNDADDDLDEDGLTNAMEFQKAADPQNQDTDGDGVLDGVDAFPLSADESFDTDGDGVGDNTDNCLNVSNPDQTDTDGDGKGDVCDYDICPAGFDTQPSYTGDCQNRPPGTVCAVFSDAYVWLISESVTGWNTQGDLQSAYGTSNEHQHLLGSNCIKMIALDADRDGDGVPDDLEDNCLDFFNPRTNWVDINGDAHADAQADFDLDEIGDPCDPDDDNDGVVDAEDNCPFAFNQKVNGLQPDLDGDGIGNACDQDADGDGYVFFIYFDPAVHLNGYDCDDSNPDPAYINGDCLGSAAPKKKNTIQDRDGDGITDDQDSCPDDPNIGDSDGDGIDGACDGCDIAGLDPDRDNICTANDNCPDVFNPAQLASDCPPPVVDADGDGFSPPEDCNDDDQKIYPGAPEIIDGVDNDCNDAIDDTNAYFVHFEMTGYDNWLPEDGNTAIVTVSVRSANPDGSTVSPNPPGFTAATVAGSESAMPGKYTNDPSELSGADITYTLAGNRLEFTSQDYGGKITVRVEAKVTVGGVVYPVFGEFTLPKDADKDGLPDKWEMDVTNSLSTLTSADGDPDGDGLSNGKEFRGFMWGPEMAKIPGSLSGTYQTDAWVPKGDAKHFRTDPQNLKDLFVKVTGYDFNSGNGDNGYEAPCDCPFALGDAFHGAGVAVHVLSMNNPPAFMGANAAADDVVKWEHSIDVVTITNYQTGTFSTSDGDINKIGIRDWNWDIKGFSGIGNETLYGGGTRTYQVPLDNIFTQEPYIDGSEHTGNDLGGNPVFLDRIDGASVEDKNDNGLDDYNKKAKQYEAEVFQDLDVLGGDVLAQPISFDHSHSAFDVDGDGRVEIPLINDPSKPYSGDYIYEYTKAQMLKGTLSHELGHAIGMSHTTVPTCLMFEYTNNYHRDNFFSDSARAAMRIHNIEEQP